MSEDKRILALENRVSMLEKEVAFLKTKALENERVKNGHVAFEEKEKGVIAEQKDTSIAVSLEPIMINKPTVQVNSEHAPAISSKSKKTEVDWEKLLGQVWLPRIFIFVLILGILWGFKAAVDSGFITEPIRVVLGMITAGVLIYLGEKQIKKNREALGQVLLGGSVVIFILSTFAAHMLYGLIVPSIAFILNVLWVILGIYLSHRHNSQPISIIAAVAGFLVPYLVENKGDSTLFLVAYEVIFYLSLLKYALLKKFIYLYITSGGLLHISLLIMCVFPGDQIEAATVAIMVQHVFLLLTFLRKKLFITAQKATLFTSFVLTQLWAGVGFADALYFSFLAIFFAVYTVLSYVYFGKNKEKLNITLPIATYALSMFLLDISKEEHIGLAFLIEGVIALYIGLAGKIKNQTIAGGSVYALGVLLTAFDEIERFLSIETVAWLMMIVSLFTVGYAFKKFKLRIENKRFSYNSIINLLSGFTVFSILSFIVQVLDNKYEGVAVLLEGLIAFYIAVKQRLQNRVVVSAIVYVIGVTFITLNGIEEVISFETVAWIAMLTSFVYMRKLSDNLNKFFEDTSGFLNILFGATAIYILVFITQLGAVATVSFSNNIQSLTISSLWAIYAIVGVVYGAIKRNKKIRLLGIGLLFLTLLKLIFIDMASISILVRAILFIGLGFIGVALSRFFYSNKKGE